ncbi:asparagine synthetase, putative [Ricinus communis]|uniref:Asparagine synthetase, putative n=1 Tax=Ricinus communis TaxID=3988 RepID=B9REC9_RICCO|nr:asparagine synthetase, putative [Ricinus communis]
MCGIALIISGIRIALASPDPKVEPVSSSNIVISINDLKLALQRRGPDSLGSKKLIISAKDQELFSVIKEEDHNSANEEPCLHFVGATLQLRGLYPVTQPFLDSSKNILIYNGEIFGGIHVGSDSNDGEMLMRTLGSCCSCSSCEHICFSSRNDKNYSVLDVLSAIKGPWAVIYWQDSSKTLWFGRDALGRRSLLVHWPTVKVPRFLLSSVSPFSYVDGSYDLEVEESTKPNFWEELPCGVYSLSVATSTVNGCLAGEVKKHEWASSTLTELIKWERVSVEPKPQDLNFSCGPDQTSILVPAQNVLGALRKSVMLRTSLHAIFQAGTSDSGKEEQVPVAVLFSGGLDSMILAALLDECLDPSFGIDLLNVSFDGEFAPDRISGQAGVEELRRIAPMRRCKDLNIGIALWLAASGYGWVSQGTSNSNGKSHQRYRHKSKARIVLVGSGADEQCAGYGRHRTKYRCGSWLGLHEEMKLDMQRIWKRNMGRDDRCIADNGKEARFPFLDEDVIRTLLDIPLWEVANLNQPSGTGDKKILREVARMLGLHEAAVLPKRAIQFGSRIARESNRKNFGSNRAANQASAGSVVVNMP